MNVPCLRSAAPVEDSWRNSSLGFPKITSKPVVRCNRARFARGLDAANLERNERYHNWTVYQFFPSVCKFPSSRNPPFLANKPTRFFPAHVAQSLKCFRYHVHNPKRVGNVFGRAFFDSEISDAGGCLALLCYWSQCPLLQKPCLMVTGSIYRWRQEEAELYALQPIAARSELGQDNTHLIKH